VRAPPVIPTSAPRCTGLGSVLRAARAASPTPRSFLARMPRPPLTNFKAAAAARGPFPRTLSALPSRRRHRNPSRAPPPSISRFAAFPPTRRRMPGPPLRGEKATRVTRWDPHALNRPFELTGVGGGAAAHPVALHRRRCRLCARPGASVEFAVALASSWCKPHTRSCSVDRNRSSSPEPRRPPPRTAARRVVVAHSRRIPILRS
jgi:hypothetical protein